MTIIETKITNERAEILQSLTDRATAVLKYVELERAGIHAEIILGKCPINNTSLIDYIGGEITELAGELSENIFREERPAEYAAKQLRDKQDHERWCNDPEIAGCSEGERSGRRKLNTVRGRKGGMSTTKRAMQ